MIDYLLTFVAVGFGAAAILWVYDSWCRREAKAPTQSEDYWW